MVKKYITKQDVEAIDVHTMEKLSPQEYRQYILSEGLFMVDHHDILRSSCAGYPIAVSKEQLDIYKEELEKIKHRLR
ncbi:hypothetical protein [Aeromonas hydrophila]|uniref:hypothetical protein n=1 Tax=Aeromonas hydrophila TaxID=644 RepID=UPI0005A840D2|nr:hypothetical protein [Aeromonas hydrophila]